MRWLSNLLRYRSIRRGLRGAAAYHEAGHVVAAVHSAFHFMPLGASIRGGGFGEANVGLSRSKCAALGKPTNPSAALDPDVVQDIAVILVAGYVAERLVGELAPATRITSDPTGSNADRALLAVQHTKAGLIPDVSAYERNAEAVLREHWTRVETIASYLIERGEIDQSEIASIIASN